MFQRLRGTAAGASPTSDRRKWYPGRTVAALVAQLLLARKDGEPLWNDPALIADETLHSADEALAGHFLRRASPNGSISQHVFPAFGRLLLLPVA